MGRISILLASLMVVVSTVGSTATAFDYKGALEMILLFFEAQQSGKLPSDHRVKWRGDSALTDGFKQGVDLVGGYYDAGDHVKFGFPMAFAVTMLSWGVIEFEKEMITANQLKQALGAIRWGTDYFLKAHKAPNTLWVQVGDGDCDHLCWERAEDMTTSRTAYKVDTNDRGSEVAGETAAALAAASRAFRPYDAKYSNLLLLHAKQLFSFADTFRGWAVKEFYWDNKYAGLQVLLTKVLLQAGSAPYSSVLKQYQAKAEFFICACLQKNRGHDVLSIFIRVPIWIDRSGGLLYFDDWNNMQYVPSAGFLLAVYSDYLSASKSNLKCPDGEIQPLDILRFAQSQVDYILGKNPKSVSYLVGYGGSSPTHVHHRGASMPSIFAHPAPIGCIDGFENWPRRQGQILR